MKKVARFRAPQEQMNATFPTGSSSDNVSVRTTGRIKKPKTVYDPSDNYVPRSQRLGAQTPLPFAYMDRPESRAGSERTSDDSAEILDCCAICLKREAKRGVTARTNKLVTCVECERKIHRMCMHAEFEDLETVRNNFKCDICRTCERCDARGLDSAKKGKELITCVRCAKSFHSACHIPAVQKHQQSYKNWLCSKCAKPSPSAAPSKPLLVRAPTPMPKKMIREIIGYKSGPLLPPPPPPPTAVLPKLPTLPPPGPVASRPKKEWKTPAAVLPVKEKSPKQPQTKENSTTATASKQSVAASTSLLLEPSVPSSSSDSSQSNGVAYNNSSDEYDDEPKKPKLSEPKTAKKPIQNGDSSITPAPVNNTTVHYSSLDEIELPDVKGWSVDQVEVYFAKYFPNEAHVFKEHEIDGLSLLLLKRSDVVRKLPIKLGPAMRLYNLILKIQTRRNDPTLGWNCVP